MKLNSHEAPHIRHQENARGLTASTALTLLFLYGMACFYYGPRSVALGLISTLCAVLCDAGCTLLASHKPNPRDLSPVVTGLLIPLFLPASVPYHVAVVAAVVAIVVVKHPFGGLGHNVFNPAAAGLCFAAICFPDQIFSYPMPTSWLPAFGPVEAALHTSSTFTLSLGGIPNYEYLEMLLGNFPGPMGATNILVILACLLYLVLRNIVGWELPVCFFLTAAAFITLFPRGGAELGLDLSMRLRLTAYEMMSGGVLLGGTYLLGDPVTTPKRKPPRVLFGVIAGVVVMLYQRYGGYELSIPFAVLTMNAVVWGLDMAAETLAHHIRRRKQA